MEQTLLQETSLLAEESKSAAIAVRLAMITDDVLHHGMADLVGRTGNALNAVAEVAGILASADTARGHRHHRAGPSESGAAMTGLQALNSEGFEQILSIGWTT